MGNNNKHAADWTDTKLQVILDAKKLYTHSVKIMGNEKVFEPSNDFRGRTLIKVHDLLLDTYMKISEANRINAEKMPELAERRLMLQYDALSNCNDLLSLFELVKSQFHLSSKKFWNWMTMLVDFCHKLRAWHKSDNKRYRENKNLSSNDQNGSRLDQRGNCVVEVC